MKRPPKEMDLSRRERQLVDALYRLGTATAAELRDAIESPPSYTAVRTHLANLEDKGVVLAKSDGVRHIYEPTVPRAEMAGKAIENVLSTFFENRLELVVSTLLRKKDLRTSPEELDRLAQMIDEARKEGR